MAPVREALKARFSRITMWHVVEGALIAAIAVQTARLVWALAVPLGPVGNWQPPKAQAAAVDPGFDPFFRTAGGANGAAVTALPLKLFGIRLDEATGRGSAIIATPDGVQSSFGVGEEVMPGVRLKSVALDHAVLDRGGVEEQLFIDQSVPVSAPAVPGVGLPTVSVPAPVPSLPPVANSEAPVEVPLR